MFPLTDAPITVLHVDDEATVTTLAQTALERAYDDLTVVSETSAEAGLERLDTDDVDCVVLDYRMPAMDGLEFLRRVRRVDTDLPVIFFTGRGDETVASEAITAGTTDYIVKGIDEQFERLGDRILTLVGRYRAAKLTAETLDHVRAIFDRIDDGVIALDDRWRLTYLNQAAMELFDVEAMELYGRVVWDAVPALDDTDFSTTVRESAADETSVAFETHVEAIERWFGVITYPSDGGVTLLLRDLTTARTLTRELEQTRAALRSTEQQFDTLRKKVSRPHPRFR